MYYEPLVAAGLLLLAAIIAFPVYVLVRLAQLGRAVSELREGVARGHAHEAPAQPRIAPAVPIAPPAPGPPAGDVGELAPRVAAPPPPAQPPRAPPLQPPMPPPPPSAPPPAREMRDLESVLGANWLSKLGMAAIVIAAAFFLKYAFESGWIGPSARVAMGLVAAGVLVAVGQVLLARPRYQAYAQVLTSGGIVILFLSIYAAYNFYHLIPFAAAFGVLAVAALAASALAVANDTEAVAALCILGAFATPALIQQAGAAGRESGDLIRPYAYLAGLNVWSAFLLGFRPWHSLTVISFAATWLLFFGAGPLSGPRYPATEAFALLFLVFACYGGMRAAAGTGEDVVAERVAVSMILAGCVAFVAASALILVGVTAFGVPPLMLVAVLIALLLAGFALAFSGPSEQRGVLRGLFRYLAAAALVLLVAISIAGAPPVPRGQVVASFVFGLFSYLLFLAVAIHMTSQPAGGGAAAALVAANALAHVLVTFHVLAPLRIWSLHAAPLWLPIAVCITLLALWWAAAQERESRPFRVAVVVTAQLLPVLALVGAWALAYGWHPARGVALFGGEFLLVSAMWIAARRLVSWSGFRGDLLAAFGNAAVFFGLLAAAARLHAYEGLVLLCGCAVAMAAYHALVGGSVLRRPEDDALIRFTYLGLGITFLTIAIPLQLKAHYITLAWAVESAVLVWTGLAAADRRVRWAGIVLLSVTAGKALLIDIARTPEAFRLLLNARMLSGACVIAAAYVSAYLLRRGREALPEEERSVPAVLGIIGNAYTLIFVSLDIWQYVEQVWPVPGRASAQQLGLSLFWSVYALGAMSVGVWQRTRPVRLFALGLLCTAVVKVFLFDLRFLETPYRIVSFFVLGLILMAIALLYTRFESRLK